MLRLVLTSLIGLINIISIFLKDIAPIPWTFIGIGCEPKGRVTAWSFFFFDNTFAKKSYGELLGFYFGFVN